MGLDVGPVDGDDDGDFVGLLVGDTVGLVVGSSVRLQVPHAALHTSFAGPTPS